MRRCSSTSLATAACAALLAACGGPDQAAVPVERTDSAGVELVRSLGPDVPLDWTFETVLTLGGKDEGPEAFYQVGNTGIGTDAAGNIHVLDGGNGQVQIFGPDGAHLRTVGRRGEGPGELGQFLYGMAVAPDGAIAVFDAMKRTLVRWDAAGQVLPSIEVAGQPSGRFALLDDGSVMATLRDGAYQGDSARYVLRILEPSGATEDLLAMFAAPLQPVDFECVMISGMAPLFQPEMRFDRAGSGLVVSSGPDYRVEGRKPDGAVHRVVSRDLPPVAATAELAAIESDSMTVRFGDGRSCVVPADEVVEQRGFEPVVPAVRQLVGAPDGSFWVQRGYGSERRVIDVFAADGAYVGTLPAGTPWPAALLDGETLLVRTTDEYDREMVEVRRIVPGS
ncbi:MAG: 6-bladed beta-propeller [Gemmatimonadota bacterium]